MSSRSEKRKHNLSGPTEVRFVEKLLLGRDQRLRQMKSKQKPLRSSSSQLLQSSEEAKNITAQG
jgi:hypothetical protein